MLRALESRCPSCFSQRVPTDLLCVANASTAAVGDYAYDRKASVACTGDAVRVEPGDPFTVIALFGQRPEAFFPGPHIEQSSMSRSGQFPMHSAWYFLYILDGETDEPTNMDMSLRMASSGAYDTERCLGGIQGSGATQGHGAW